MSKIIVGITGASGAAVAIRTLELARDEGVETHAVISSWGLVNLRHELSMNLDDVRRLSTHLHSNRDLASEISSGSYQVDAMLVVPCSARTLGTIATGTGDTLISRAADVTLKERRKLILALRESPLSSIHLRNALTVSEAGAYVVPLSPSFYTLPKSIDKMISVLAARLLDHADISSPALPRWTGSSSLSMTDVSDE